MAERTLIDFYEELIEEETERAIKAAAKLFDLFGDRPLGMVKLTPTQELQRLTDLMGTDDDVMMLSNMFTWPELLAMAHRKQQLEAQLGVLPQEMNGATTPFP